MIHSSSPYVWSLEVTSRFQADTGAQCNVVPADIYKPATGDVSLSKVTPTKNRFIAYGGPTLPVVVTVLLRVWRGDYRCRLDCKLVDCEGVGPLLGHKACQDHDIPGQRQAKQTGYW